MSFLVIFDGVYCLVFKRFVMLSSRYDVITVCDTSDTRCCMLDYGVTVISVTESDLKHYYIQD